MSRARRRRNSSGPERRRAVRPTGTGMTSAWQQNGTHYPACYGRDAYANRERLHCRDRVSRLSLDRAESPGIITFPIRYRRKTRREYYATHTAIVYFINCAIYT